MWQRCLARMRTDGLRRATCPLQLETPGLISPSAEFVLEPRHADGGRTRKTLYRKLKASEPEFVGSLRCE